MARLSHPNVIAVYDVGQLGEQVFVAMELVDGGTLHEWLARKRHGWREILRVFVHAGHGLAAAHAPGSCTATSSPRTCSSATTGGCG